MSEKFTESNEHPRVEFLVHERFAIVGTVASSLPGTNSIRLVVSEH